MWGDIKDIYWSMALSMNNARLCSISSGLSKLTEEEIKQGWHFCPDWDEMLINANDASPEAECCLCFRKEVSLDHQR